MTSRILNLNLDGKASDLDSISHHMLKKTCNTVCVPLSLLFNLSLSKSEFPMQSIFYLKPQGHQIWAYNYLKICRFLLTFSILQYLIAFIFLVNISRCDDACIHSDRCYGHLKCYRQRLRCNTTK
jgi:hypothetical protein